MTLSKLYAIFYPIRARTVRLQYQMAVYRTALPGQTNYGTRLDLTAAQALGGFSVRYCRQFSIPLGFGATVVELGAGDAERTH